MGEVERISRDALREVRAAVSGYRTEGLMAEMARARLSLEAAGIGLEYLAMPVELDPARETVLAMALREAVTNVVRHAGARTCRIALEELRGDGGEGVRLEVRDDGRGGASPDGMGLSVMRDRVEGMGGSVERRGEGGTAVVITLPKRQAPAACRLRRSAAGDRGGAVISVLLAEDQSMVLGALAALLELETDIEVVGRARDGAEALRLARESRPDVVVTDIEMPGMTGLELAAALRREAPAPRIVILTTFAAAATCAAPSTPAPPATS